MLLSATSECEQFVWVSETRDAQTQDASDHKVEKGGASE